MPQVKGLKDLKLPVGQQRRKAGMMDGTHGVGTKPLYLLFFYSYPYSTSIELRSKRKFDAGKQPL
jgi:hypothetical protein